MSDQAHPEPAPPGARQRLLAAADRLFYARGITGTGVDALIAEADVARMTLYKHFGGKAGLVRAYLDERDARWRGDLDQAIAAADDDPPSRLLAVFDALERWLSDPDFRGCSFINAAAELPGDDDPARQVALRHKQVLRHRLVELAKDAQAGDAELVADQLMLLLEGTITATALHSVDRAINIARATARQLIRPTP